MDYIIYTNEDFNNAINELKLQSITLLKKINIIENIYIFKINEEDYNSLLILSFWKPNWGWWRNYQGNVFSNNPYYKGRINGKDILLLYDESQLFRYVNNLRSSKILNLEDFWPVTNLEEIIKEEKEAFIAENCSFNDITEYCDKMWDITKTENIIYILFSLAALNKVEMFELLDYLNL